MIVLGIETATPQTSVAFGTETEILGAVSVSAGRGHQEVLAPAIEVGSRLSERRLQAR